jgi:hypothetical protein
MDQRLKTAGVWLLRIALAVATMVLFFGWAPWIASHPVTQLDPTQVPAEGVPSWARSFTISHGLVVFHERGTVRDMPYLFAAYTVLMAASALGLFFSFPKHLRGRRKADADGKS